MLNCNSMIFCCIVIFHWTALHCHTVLDNLERVVVKKFVQKTQLGCFFGAFFMYRSDLKKLKKSHLKRGKWFENFDFPIVGSKINIAVNLSVTYQNLSGEKQKSNGKRISSIQLTQYEKSHFAEILYMKRHALLNMQKVASKILA